MARRGIQEINAGSMADIAFLLLIFFLVTTTMDVDRGITRKLPPPVPEEEKEKIDVPERNVFVVLINSADRLLVGKYTDKRRMDITQLKAAAKDFLRPHPGNEAYPETKEKTIEGLGTVTVSKGVISMQNDRGTSYNMYIQVQDELAGAVRELRDEMAMQYFGKKFGDLKDEIAVKAIQKAIPVAISEAEPKNVGGN
ncbi:MAG: biopolymer transporter ExbD [Bacteroidales bacterium]|nr:biopolymer transporter ExbD [Bacteroidales bacterium]